LWLVRANDEPPVASAPAFAQGDNQPVLASLGALAVKTPLIVPCR